MGAVQREDPYQSPSSERTPCLSSLTFLLRPLLSGIKRRCVMVSIARTNSAVPSGLPVCVHSRMAAVSSSESFSRKYCRQLELSQRSCHCPSSSKPSLARARTAPRTRAAGRGRPSGRRRRREHSGVHFHAASRGEEPQPRSPVLIAPRLIKISEIDPCVPCLPMRPTGTP